MLSRREFLSAGVVSLAPAAGLTATPTKRKGSDYRHRVNIVARLLAVVSAASPAEIRALADRIGSERIPPIGRNVRLARLHETGFHDAERERELTRLLGVVSQLSTRHVGGWYALAKGGVV